jgi:hypothetical protein
MLALRDVTDDKLVFTDNDIEKSSIIAPALDLIHGKAISMERYGPVGYRLYRIVKLLPKYECDAALTIVRLLIRNEAISGQETALHLFEAAVCLNDVGSSQALIRRSRTWFSYGHPGKDFGDPLSLYKSRMDPVT